MRYLKQYMESYKVGIASDHAGYALKEFVIEYLLSRGYAVKDYGCQSSESCDYPDYAHLLAESIVSGENRFGVAICSSANGISITLNRHPKVRAAICWKPELATLARQHNDANICSLPANFISRDEAVSILDAFFKAQFEGGRHQRRVDKIEISK